MQSNGAAVDLNPAGNLMQQITKPIPTFGATASWFFTFVPFPVAEVNQAKIRVTVADYKGKESSVETLLGGNGDVIVSIPSAPVSPTPPVPTTRSDAESQRIQLAGDVLQTILGASQDSLGKKIGFAFVQAQVRNIGKAPSIADDYHLQLKCPTHTYLGHMETPSESLVDGIVKDSKLPAAHFSAGYLPTNSARPIVAGGESRGWLLALFPDVEDMAGKDVPGCEWRMSFYDVLGKEYSIVSKTTGKERQFN